MPLAPESRRWDSDERGRGVADARSHVPAIEQLAQLAESADWIAEDPESHLLTQIRTASEAAGMTVKSAKVETDGALDVELYGPHVKSPRELREGVWRILGAVAELSTYVQETKVEGTVSFEVVTGIPPGQGRFATHGHTLRIRIEGR